jgi:competence ComEA-like helix-hairpin-helix protein
LVKGMTVEDLYGTEEKKGLIRYLSVYDAEEGKVNINTAPAEVLQSLSDAIDWGQAEAIIAYRQEQPFKSKADLRRVPGMEAIYAAIEKDITCQSSTFSLRVEGRVREIKKVIFAVLKRDTGKAVKPIFWRVE